MRKKTTIIIILSLLIVISFLFQYQIKNYKKEFSYLDSSIIITIKTNKNGKKILDHIQNIYQDYEQLIDREKSYNSRKNLYYLLYNKSDQNNIKIDRKLYNLIYYGKDIYIKSNKKVDISIGNIINIWNMYIDSKSGYPSNLELKRIKKESVDDIVLLDHNQIKNNHINIYLDEISKSYVTDEVIKYLKKQNIIDYEITIDKNMYVGEKKDEYKIAIENPNGNYTIIKGNNIAISSRYENDNSYTYQNQIYNNLISKETLKQPRKMKGVSVITNNIKESDSMSLMLYMMDIEDGKKYVEKHGLEAIWYTNDGKIIFSSGIKKYLK